MHYDETLRNLAQAYGIYTEFHQFSGDLHHASPDTLRVLLGALGVDAENQDRASEALTAKQHEDSSRLIPREYVIRAGEPADIHVAQPCHWQLLNEAGDLLAEGHAEHVIHIPAQSVGYGFLHVDTNGLRQTAFMPIRPPAAPVLGQRDWGWVTALYGLRSNTNGGLGNFRDLKQAAQGLAQGGAGFLGINPVHALGWAETEMISPYSPSHRGFFSTDHIATTADLGPTPADTLVDYSTVRPLVRRALEAEFKTFGQKRSSGEQNAFAGYLKDGPEGLSEFAHFEALSEVYGGDFRQWPSAATQAGQVDPERVKFHSWLQWRAETQLAEAHQSARSAGMSQGLYLDLAVGSRRGGAEVWMNQSTIAKGVSVGAPPDHLSPDGQSWDLAGYAPNRLAEEHYLPFRRLLSRMMQHCGILRIDHALGMLRSFWAPDDGNPGTYIAQSFETLLAIVTIEAQRNGCAIIGEDLGLVPDGFRERLHNSGLYSYSVWQYETYEDGWLYHANDLRSFSLSCFSTHDTPTVAGFWTGRDLDHWDRLGWIDESDQANQRNRREHQRNSLRAHCEFEGDIAPKELNLKIGEKLAGSQVALVACQLDDAFGVIEAHNLPGTVSEHDNWQRRCPEAVENFHTSQEIADLSAVLKPLTQDT